MEWTPKQLKRFWSKVRKGKNKECWEWLGWDKTQPQRRVKY